MKYKITNQSQTEHAQADTPNPKLKTLQELSYSKKNIKRKRTNSSKSTVQYNSKNNKNKHTTARRIRIYQMRCTAYKVATDDGLIQSETCRASNGK